MDYLGYRIDAAGLHPLEDKVEAGGGFHNETKVSTNSN